MKSFNPLELTKNTHMFHILCIVSIWQHFLKKTYMYGKLSKCRDLWSSQKTCLLLYLLDEQTKHFFLELHCTMYVFLYICKQFISVFFCHCFAFCFASFCLVFLFFSFGLVVLLLSDNVTRWQTIILIEMWWWILSLVNTWKWWFFCQWHSLVSGRAWLDY